jgi:hypothetical protein
MSLGSGRSASDITGRRASRGLIAACVGCLVGAGFLLWARHGEAVFSKTVLAALAWCF